MTNVRAGGPPKTFTGAIIEGKVVIQHSSHKYDMKTEIAFNDISSDESYDEMKEVKQLLTTITK